MNKRSDFLHWSGGIAMVLMTIEIAHLVKTNVRHNNDCMMSKFSMLAMGIFILTVIHRLFIRRRK